ncbi:MAG: hypothetical protein GY711_10850 [bacterium]|nr:hypothetical protein [bacterium]
MTNQRFHLIAPLVFCCLALPAHAQLSNQDDCVSASIDTIGPGLYVWDNSGATTGTEGQVEAICYKFGTSAVQSDVWVRYVVAASGSVTIDTCGGAGTNADTKIAAYPDADCNTIDGTAVACNDDTCGLRSSITFSVDCGESYLLQLGSFPGSADGTADLLVLEAGAPCVPCPTNTLVCVDIPAGENPECMEMTVTVSPAGLIACTQLTMDPGGSGNQGVVTTSGNDVAIEWPSSLSGGTTICFELLAPPGADVTYMAGDGHWTPSMNEIQPQNVTICPLGVGPLGASYCGPAVPNSTGAPGTISANGNPWVQVNELSVFAQGLPPGQFGYFLASETQGFFSPPSSQGNLCLAGNVGRFNQAPDVIQGPSGSILVNLGSIPVNPPRAVLPGETWNFQCWYRDLNPGQTSNFTDAVTIQFQ